jgi:glycerol-3-phosphate O-acyltransferase
MVDRPGRILTWVVTWLLRSVVFARRQIDAVRDAQQRGSVVHVLPSRSIIDFLYFNVSFLQHDLQLARFSNGLNTWGLRPMGASLRALFRRRRSEEEERRAFRGLVDAAVPTALFLTRPGHRADRDAGYVLPWLEEVVRSARALEGPVLLLPMTVIWDRRPNHHRATWLDDVFGTRQDPGFFRRLLYVAQNVWQSFLQLGEPTVQLVAPIDVRAVIDALPSATDTLVAAHVRDLLLDTFERERRVAVGPAIKSAARMRDEILDDHRTRDAVLQVARDQAAVPAQVFKRSSRILTEIAADFNLLFIKLLSAVLTLVWNQIYEGIEVDHEGLERIRETARDHRLVIVPSHKSHIDYLVISYVFYRNGLLTPHIAAGLNLSFWPLGTIFRRSGAFFLRRSFAGDPLYPILFNAYLVKLLEEGIPIEFFIEGTRSRTGKLNPPKYGMLNMIVDAYRSGEVDQLAFIPVSVGYENIIEGSSYRAELQGGEKKNENIGALLRTPQVLGSRYGRVYVEFGNPIDAGNFFAQYHGDSKGSLQRTDLDRTVRRLAYRIIHSINDVTTVSPSSLAALILLHARTGALAADELVERAGFVLDLLRSRDARMSRTLRANVNRHLARIARSERPSIDPSAFDEFDREYIEAANADTAAWKTAVPPEVALGEAVVEPLNVALELLAKKRLVERTDRGWSCPPDRRIELAYYRNNIVHFLVPDAVFASAVCAARRADGHVPLSEAAQYAAFLSRILKYEFCFEERREFQTVFDRSCAWFVEREWLHHPEPSTLVLSEESDAMRFVRQMLLPTLESYWLAALTLTGMGADTVDERTLTRRTLQRARQLQTLERLRLPESMSQPTIENAWRIFREWGVLEAVTETGPRRRGRLYRLESAYHSPLLGELVDVLLHLRDGQARATGDLLHRIVPPISQKEPPSAPLMTLPSTTE